MMLFLKGGLSETAFLFIFIFVCRDIFYGLRAGASR